mmetsp:Transcript_16748/g.25820  ORF Transcript_16748/g.25820 Transcript_16748/m.25820 type:complete len:124 (+) Transcript_16748:2655-3026(+)
MVKTSDPLLYKGHKEKKSIRSKERKVLFERLNSGATTTWKELRQDSEFVELRRRYDPDFEELFQRAYRAYLEGNWGVAGKSVRQLISLRPFDGPSQSLNKVINVKHKGQAPADWKGYRPLTSK